MNRIVKFHLDVAAKLEELRGRFAGGFCSITNTGGVTHEVSLPNAARMLIEQSARLATPEEIEEQARNYAAQREMLLRSETAQRQPRLAITVTSPESSERK